MKKRNCENSLCTVGRHQNRQQSADILIHAIYMDQTQLQNTIKIVWSWECLKTKCITPNKFDYSKEKGHFMHFLNDRPKYKKYNM